MVSTIHLERELSITPAVQVSGRQLGLELAEITTHLIERGKVSEKDVSKAFELILDLAKDYDYRTILTMADCGVIGAFFSAAAFATKYQYSPDFVLGAGSVLAKRVRKIHLPVKNVVDIFATGGEKTRTVYVTPAAAILASVHVPVVVQGTFAITGCLCGGWAESDIVESLGMRLELTDRQVQRIFVQTDFVYLEEKYFHEIGKFLPLRSRVALRDPIKASVELGSPTGSRRRLIPVYSKDLVDIFSYALQHLGTEHSIVTTCSDGCDEFSPAGTTYFAEIKRRKRTFGNLRASHVGITKARNPSILLGGSSASEDAKIIESVFAGSRTGPIKDIILMNAGAAIYLGGASKSIRGGVQLASEAIRDGSALHQLHKIQAAYKNLD